jgi:hypothetical protein
MRSHTKPSGIQPTIARIVRRTSPNGAVIAIIAFALLATALTAAPALALPEGRVYEMVSPPYKAGYPVEKLNAVAPDGESVAFSSQGSFDGVLSNSIGSSYLARRSYPSGWSTTGLQPPSGLVGDYSANLGYALAGTLLGPNVGWANIEGNETEYLLQPTDAPSTSTSWGVFGGIVLKRTDGRRFQALLQGSSGDLCHLVVGEAEGAFLPEAEGTINQLYDLSRGCGGESSSLRLVGVRNRLGPSEEPEVIDRHCSVRLGREGNAFDAIAAGGAEIFFTTNVQPSSYSCGGSTDPAQLFVRLGAARTLEVSKPAAEACTEVPCPNAAKHAPAFFQGAAEDGSTAFFTTTEPLEPATDKDEGNDLYMARFGCPGGREACPVAEREVTSLAQVSRGGEPAEVQGVVKVAPDGSRVYFVARGVLSSEGPSNSQAQGAQPQPLRGADNLYVYDSATGGLAFLADLCSGPEASGAAGGDPRCPADLPAEARIDAELWSSFAPQAQTTADGRFLVFSTYAQLLRGDTDNARDVYRYDAQTRLLGRVSLGEAGYHENGNGHDNGQDPGGADAFLRDAGLNQGSTSETHEMHTRAISEDGSRIVFQTAEPLSQAATNHLNNVYEWHKQEGWSEGRVSLVSGGSAPLGDGGAVITPDGRNIFFTTSEGLVPQDTDGVVDIYDARLEGGFPPPPGERQPCSSDACQGPLTNPAPLLVPGSASQAAGENLPPPQKSATKGKKQKKQKKRRAPKKRGRKAGHQARSSLHGKLTYGSGGRR